MKVVVAIDSFKDCMSSIEAGNAAKQGVLKACPDAGVQVIAVADGGEGTVDALCSNSELRTIYVTGPLGNKIEASYSIISRDELKHDSSDSKNASDRIAVIEMASAAGLMLVPCDARNPLNTTTYGVGEMIRDAIECGCRDFIIGIGGSATNDGGIGMLQALGFSFLDEGGNDVAYGAKGLIKLCDIGFENVIKELSECSFRVACDVDNPLVGEKGASRVFAPQKGADAAMVNEMEAAMNRYAMLVEHIAACNASELHKTFNNNCKKTGQSIDRFYSGTGAAGGMGYAFLMFLNARLEPGIDIILDEINFKNMLADADYVITGEGKLDSQTIRGKTPAGVARAARQYDKKVLAFAGSLEEGYTSCIDEGLFDACFPIVRGVCTLEAAIDKQTAMANMTAAVEQAFRLLSMN